MGCSCRVLQGWRFEKRRRRRSWGDLPLHGAEWTLPRLGLDGWFVWGIKVGEKKKNLPWWENKRVFFPQCGIWSLCGRSNTAVNKNPQQAGFELPVWLNQITFYPQAKSHTLELHIYMCDQLVFSKPVNVLNFTSNTQHAGTHSIILLTTWNPSADRVQGWGPVETIWYSLIVVLFCFEHADLNYSELFRTSKTVRANGWPRWCWEDSSTRRLSPFRSTLDSRCSLESTQ